MGGLGNRLFQYCAARAYAEKYGYTLHVPESVLDKIFDIDHPRPTQDLPRLNEDTANGQEGGLYGYFQNQKSIDLYTRTKARGWLRFRPEILDMMSETHRFPLVIHRRAGDYRALGYPIPSYKSYDNALRENFREDMGVHLVSDEFPSKARKSPNIVIQLQDEISFLPDFFVMMYADVLFRANSTFSWWAHVLGRDDQRIFSPVIDGKGGGEVDCGFVEGNHPKFCELPGITDLHLAP